MDKYHKQKKDQEKGLHTIHFYLYNILEKAKIMGNRPMVDNVGYGMDGKGAPGTTLE